jgi:hypothetical protein
MRTEVVMVDSRNVKPGLALLHRSGRTGWPIGELPPRSPIRLFRIASVETSKTGSTEKTPVGKAGVPVA